MVACPDFVIRNCLGVAIEHGVDPDAVEAASVALEEMMDERARSILIVQQWKSAHDRAVRERVDDSEWIRGRLGTVTNETVLMRQVEAVVARVEETRMLGADLLDARRENARLRRALAAMSVMEDAPVDLPSPPTKDDEPSVSESDTVAEEG